MFLEKVSLNFMEPKKNKDKYNSCLMIQNFFSLDGILYGQQHLSNILNRQDHTQQDHTPTVVQGRVDGTSC